MIPVPCENYGEGNLLVFLPEEKVFQAFMIKHRDTPPMAKQVVEKWFNQPGNKKEKDKAMLFATGTEFYLSILVKPDIVKMDAFVHLAAIMSDIIVEHDDIRMHLILFMMSEWFTEASMLDYLNKP